MFTVATVGFEHEEYEVRESEGSVTLTVTANEGGLECDVVLSLTTLAITANGKRNSFRNYIIRTTILMAFLCLLLFSLRIVGLYRSGTQTYIP